MKNKSKHSPTLFRDDSGNGLHFSIKAGVRREGLEELIKNGGGLIYEEPTEYTITLASPDHVVSEGEELYSYVYIRDCCEKNTLLNLTPYRLNKESKYPHNFNPNNVLLKYTTWQDALQGKPFKTLELPFKPSDSESDSSVSTDATSFSPVLARRNGMEDSEGLGYSGSEFFNSECLNKLDHEVNSKMKEKKSSGDVGVSSSTGFRIAETISRNAQEENRRKARSSESENSELNTITPGKNSLIVMKKRKEKKLKRPTILESSDSEFCDEENVNKSGIQRNLQNKVEKTLCSEDNGGTSLGKRSKVAEPSVSSGAKIYSREIETPSESDEPDANLKAARKVARHGGERQSRKERITSDSEESDAIFRAASLSRPRSKLKLMRRDYSDSERKKIIKYIVEKKAYGLVKGREMWQKMEAKTICPGRTWQSLKEHFIKKILPRIDMFGLPEEIVRNFRLQEQRKCSDTDSSGSASSAESGKRRDYTNAEKMKIINYIIRCKAYKHVKGREFWQRMEMSKICPGRTWQSLKEHYTKQILPRIDSFGLSDDIVYRLKMVYRK